MRQPRSPLRYILDGGRVVSRATHPDDREEEKTMRELDRFQNTPARFTSVAERNATPTTGQPRLSAANTRGESPSALCSR